MTRRIIWLAAADARGHLMRAHLMRNLLAAHDVQVDLVTTSDDGAQFLAALGTPSRVLSRHYRMEFDGSHNIDPSATRRRVVRYLLDPRRFLADVAAFDAIAAGADLVVNDFHPLLFVGGALGAHARPPVVQLFGAHLWEAVAGHFADHGPALLHRAHTRILRTLRSRSFACVEHSLWFDAPRETALAGASRAGSCPTVQLPPLVARPQRSRAVVRAALGLAPHERLAAVYLNPHFTDPRIARVVEDTLAALNVRSHRVGEGYANRPGWQATDAHLADTVAAADLLISGAGMGALGQSHAFGTPLLSLLADQPEQARNAAHQQAAHPETFASVSVAGELPELKHAAERLLAQRAGGSHPDATARVDALHARWTRAFLSLLKTATDRNQRSLDVQAA